jgi:hypothetical protein
MDNRNPFTAVQDKMGQATDQPDLITCFARLQSDASTLAHELRALMRRDGLHLPNDVTLPLGRVEDALTDIEAFMRALREKQSATLKAAQDIAHKAIQPKLEIGPAPTPAALPITIAVRIGNNPEEHAALAARLETRIAEVLRDALGDFPEVLTEHHGIV